MLTLIFNGSPRPRGDTAGLIDLLTAQLPGEVKVIRAYAAGISPCVDCRHCWQHPGCTVKDGWAEIDRLIRESDNIIIASPIYFSELTGPLLSLMTRLQQYFSARFFRCEEPIEKPKKGGIVLVGGGDGHMSTASETAATLLHHMNCRNIAPAVCVHNTNRTPAPEEPGIAEKITELASFFKHRE